MKYHWNQAKGLLAQLKGRDPLAVPGHKGQRFAQLSIHTWTKVHKMKKMRFRMDSPGMMLWSRTIVSWGLLLGINM